MTCFKRNFVCGLCRYVDFVDACLLSLYLCPLAHISLQFCDVQQVCISIIHHRYYYLPFLNIPHHAIVPSSSYKSILPFSNPFPSLFSSLVRLLWKHQCKVNMSHRL
uniref:Uncharacterized protein n=1 Tax=Cacopsylla melanoneura TaxID=428564 RepID=A0A8D8QAF6_9HEMI